MDTKAFRELMDKKVSLYSSFAGISDKAYGGLEWSEWYELATMTRKIDYKCYFDKEGACAHTRDRNGSSEMCCCSNCANTIGYLKIVQNDPMVIRKIAGLFLPKVGFWRKDKGCALPRKYRSAVCLGYRCDTSDRCKIESKGNMLITFMNNIRIRLINDKEIYILGKALLKISIS